MLCVEPVSWTASCFQWPPIISAECVDVASVLLVLAFGGLLSCVVVTFFLGLLWTFDKLPDL